LAGALAPLSELLLRGLGTRCSGEEVGLAQVAESVPARNNGSLIVARTGAGSGILRRFCRGVARPGADGARGGSDVFGT
jgi:hypothetical protein